MATRRGAKKRRNKTVTSSSPLQLIGKTLTSESPGVRVLPLIVGFDFGLTRTAIVKYDEIEPKILFSSTSGPRADDLEQLLSYVQQNVVETLMPYSGSMVVVDWSKSESFMRTNRVHTTYKSFLTGYIYRALLSQGSIPVILSPGVVRRVLNLRPTAPKTDVWKIFDYFWTGISLGNFNEHELDALILGWCFSLIYPLEPKETLWP